MSRRMRNLLCLSICLGLMLAPVSRASAVVSSSRALEAAQADSSRTVVDAYLARADVAAELAALGVDPELARLRAAALTPSELDTLAGRIHDAPAGGNGAITVIGITFLVLLILEIVGVIDIFKRV